MHPPTQDGLEGYLAGKPDPQFLQHIAACGECKELVGQMKENTELFRSLRPEVELDPSPGFYARVMDRIDAQRSTSIWSVFLEPLFARRLVYASALLTLLLGVMLFTSPKDEPVVAGAGPEHFLSEELPATQLVDMDQDRNTVFVQLTTYEE